MGIFGVDGCETTADRNDWIVDCDALRADLRSRWSADVTDNDLRTRRDR